MNRARYTAIILVVPDGLPMQTSFVQQTNKINNPFHLLATAYFKLQLIILPLTLWHEKHCLTNQRKVNQSTMKWCNLEKFGKTSSLNSLKQLHNRILRLVLNKSLRGRWEQGLKMLTILAMKFSIDSAPTVLPFSGS